MFNLFNHLEFVIAPDDSGFFLQMSRKKVDKVKSAGIFWLKTPGTTDWADKGPVPVLPAKSEFKFENASPVNDSQDLHPIAIRPNTNGRGVVVSGYVIRKKWANTKWTLIGRYSPNPNQEFYPVKNRKVIKKNDWLAMRCTFYNNNTHDIYFGELDSNETCNLYVMYYVNSGDIQSHICLGFGPPYYTWNSDPKLPGGKVPDWVDRDASLPVLDN